MENNVSIFVDLILFGCFIAYAATLVYRTEKMRLGYAVRVDCGREINRFWRKVDADKCYDAAVKKHNFVTMQRKGEVLKSHVHRAAFTSEVGHA